MNANQREELLTALVAGDLDLGDPLVSDALAADPTIREELEALRALERRVAAAGEDELEVLDAAATVPAGIEEERAMVHARRLFGAEPARPRTRVSPLPIGLAAAALFAIGLLLGRLGGPPPTTEPTAPRELGSGVRVVAPAGEVHRYDEFRWEFSLSNGYAYELTVWNAETGEEVVTTPRLGEPAWRPPAGLELPNRIAFTVHVLDAAGNVIARGNGDASLVR